MEKVVNVRDLDLRANMDAKGLWSSYKKDLENYVLQMVGEERFFQAPHLRNSD